MVDGISVTQWLALSSAWLDTGCTSVGQRLSAVEIRDYLRDAAGSSVFEGLLPKRGKGG
jgi:hypothetical protein